MALPAPAPPTTVRGPCVAPTCSRQGAGLRCSPHGLANGDRSLLARCLTSKAPNLRFPWPNVARKPADPALPSPAAPRGTLQNVFGPTTAMDRRFRGSPVYGSRSRPGTSRTPWLPSPAAERVPSASLTLVGSQGLHQVLRFVPGWRQALGVRGRRHPHSWILVGYGSERVTRHCRATAMIGQLYPAHWAQFRWTERGRVQGQRDRTMPIARTLGVFREVHQLVDPVSQRVWRLRAVEIALGRHRPHLYRPLSPEARWPSRRGPEAHSERASGAKRCNRPSTGSHIQLCLPVAMAVGRPESSRRPHTRGHLIGRRRL